MNKKFEIHLLCICFSLMILFVTCVLYSCSNSSSESETTSISVRVPVEEVEGSEDYKIILTLYKNENEKLQDQSAKGGKSELGEKIFVFEAIEIGEEVWVDIEILQDDVLLWYGKSDFVFVKKGNGNNVNVKMKRVYETLYLNSMALTDGNGGTESTPAKTLVEAFDHISPKAESLKIIVMSPYTLRAEDIPLLNRAGMQTVTLERYYKNADTFCSGTLITIDSTSGTTEIAPATFANITLDGNWNGDDLETGLLQTSGGSLIRIESGAYVKITAGATIKNNSTRLNDRGRPSTIIDEAGGGVLLNGGTLVMDGGTITGNKACGGGGVCVNGGTFELHAGDISNNKANTNSQGGGICLKHGFVNMTGGTITDNIAGKTDMYGLHGGGGIACYNTNDPTSEDSVRKLNVTGGSITNNKTGGYGGGIWFNLKNGTLNIGEGTSITKNHSHDKGGGLYVSDCSASGSVVTAVITENTDDDGTSHDKNYTTTGTNSIVTR